MMDSKEQLNQWLAGNPIHAEQCCPDFSCCRPELLWPREERQIFIDRPELRDGMLMMGLSVALATYNKKVHIAGFVPD